MTLFAWGARSRFYERSSQPALPCLPISQRHMHNHHKEEQSKIIVYPTQISYQMDYVSLQYLRIILNNNSLVPIFQERTAKSRGSKPQMVTMGMRMRSVKRMTRTKVMNQLRKRRAKRRASCPIPTMKEGRRRIRRRQNRRSRSDSLGEVGSEIRLL